MTLDPAALLLGPRGRRLCLELALAGAGQELSLTAFYAAHHLHPDSGSSRAVFGWGVPDPLPTLGATDVAARLRDAPVPTPDGPTLMQSLVNVVDTARYWQEPDGEDVLAAAVVSELGRVAGAAVEMIDRHAPWWTAAGGEEQWAVSFPYDDDGPLTPATALRQWRAATVQEELDARHDRPTDPREPWSGTWWSTPPRSLVRTTRGLGARGPAGLWLIEDSHGPERAVARPTRVPADVVVIDGPAAWVELCRRHPLPVTASRRHDWYRATGGAGEWVVPDWTRVAREAAGVHLTVGGYLTTAGRALPVDGPASTVLAGWDPDATYWFTDTVRPGEPRHHWAREDEEWLPA